MTAYEPDSLQDLLVFLEDQLANTPDLRIRVLPPVKPQRAPDLPPLMPGDEIPIIRGVTVRSARREYFFDLQWFVRKEYSKISDLVDEIKDQATI